MGKYLDKIRGLEPGECVPSNAPRKPASAPAIQPGSFVTWRRGDGSQPEGFVDAMHVDDAGTRWAFVALPGGMWAAVNTKFLKD